MATSTTRITAPLARLSRPRVPAPTGAAVVAALDRRADDLRRTVSLSRTCVRIDRRVAGIAMRVAVPVQAYRGVALSLATDGGGVPRYHLHLLHRDDDLSVALDEASEEAEILADWRSWSRFFGLPALVERHAGVVEPADPQCGGLAVGRAGVERRASRMRVRRRPRFLVRRKRGDLTLTALSHAGEREIVARH